MERLDAAIVVGGPAAVLVAADFAFEPVHGGSCQFTVIGSRNKKTRAAKGAQESIYTETAEFAETTEKKALGMRHGRTGDSLRRQGECGTLMIRPESGRPNCGHHLLFSIWDCGGELPECLHHADTGGDIHRVAGFALPEVRDADQTV